jgi:phosphopantetheine adenylyltransferase
MTFAEEKKKRVIAILEYIVQNQKVSKDKLIGHFCLEWGLRHQKVEEYLSELEALDLITLEPQVGSTGKFNVIDYLVYATEAGKVRLKKLKREVKHEA